MDALFIVGHIAHALIILALVWYSSRRAKVWHFNLIVAFAVLFAVEFELYREVSRACGLCIGGPDADLRVRYLFCVYFAMGLFYREVMYYAERH